MLIDQSNTWRELSRLVCRLTVDYFLRQDLMQEALLHWWLTESEQSDHTQSWLLKSCEFHILHYLAKGCSIDSLKRAGSACDFDELTEDDNLEAGRWSSEVDALSTLGLQEIVVALSPPLKPREQA